jgi:DNA-binding response OmpR family regulator
VIAFNNLMQMREGSSSPPKVIILTMFENPRILREVMKLGSNVFVHKSASVEELLSAMRTTIGDPTGENVVMMMPQEVLKESEDGSAGGVTKRELEVLVLVSKPAVKRVIERSQPLEGRIWSHLHIWPLSPHRVASLAQYRKGPPRRLIDSPRTAAIQAHGVRPLSNLL